MAGPRIEALLGELESAQEAFLGLVRGASPAQVTASGVDGTWGPAQVIAHVTEMQPFWTGKAMSLKARYPRPLTRTIEEKADRERVVAMASRQTAQHLVAGLERACRVTRERIATLADADLDLTGPRWDGSIISMEKALRMHVVDHMREHADHFQAVLESAVLPEATVEAAPAS